MMFYSDPSREHDPHALPDCEVFYHDARGGAGMGWYWQACFPGCLPDGELVGPFESEADAIADAQERSAEG